jgi:hypothetical protein
MVVIQYNCVFYVNASYSVGVFNVNASHFVCVFYVNPSHSVCECHAENIIATYVPIFVNADNFVNVLWRKNYCNLSTHICKRTNQNSKFHQVNKMTRMNIFSVSKITKNWLILFKIEVKKNTSPQT